MRDTGRLETRAGAWPTGDRSSSPRAGAAGRRAGRRCSRAGAPCARPIAARVGPPARRSSRSRRLERQLGFFFLLARTFERAAGLGEEDVVERRLVELKVLHLEALGVEGAHDLRQVGLARLEADRDALDGSAGLAEPREDHGGALLVLGARGDDLDGGPPDFRLEVCWSPFGDDPAVVDDPDPVGEHVRLFEVLRGQEDGDAVVGGEAADLLPERATAL